MTQLLMKISNLKKGMTVPRNVIPWYLEKPNGFSNG
jgi:hypothetical protein